MESVWNTTIGSLALVTFLGGLIIGFGILISALISWMWRRERDVAHTPPGSETAEKPPIRKAA